MNINDIMSDVRKALLNGNTELAKSITTAAGLVGYDLQAPAKNLYPVNTPLRNSIPRRGDGYSTALQWKTIRGLVGSGFDAMGWVPEGQRSARMSYTVNSVSAPYATLAEEDSVTFEAVSAGVNFEDVRATVTMRLLQKMMLKEENAILGGNRTLQLGTPATPTTSASGSTATLPAATYSVIVVALTYEGFKNSSVANGISTTKTITGADGNTFVLNGGSSNKSSNATQAVTLGQALYASVSPTSGAAGYAWFVGTVGNETLQAITTINSVAITAPLTASQQPISVVTGDASANANTAYDGLLTTALKSGSGAYVSSQATGTAGTGTGLTASQKGSIVEIDTMLKNMWDTNQVSPDVIYVNSQELNNITNKVLTATSGSSLRYVNDTNNKDPYILVAGGNTAYYFNPFTMGGGQKIPILLHPNMPAGTILAWANDLPAQYKSNEVPQVAEVRTRRDYYQIDWPLKTRSYEVGVYAEEVLAVYAPFAMGVINNIANL